MPSDPSVRSSSKDSWCPDPKHCVCLHFLERNCGQLNTYVGIQVEQTQAASWLSPWDGGRGQIPWDSPDPPGKEKSYWNLLSTEPQEQIILKPWGGCVMQCPNLTGFLSFPSLWNLCRRKKKKSLFFFSPLPYLFLCLVAGFSCKLWKAWNMFSIVFFLWRKLQREKERGRRGTLHSKQSQGDNCKVC